MTDGKPPSQPDGEDGSTLDASGTHPDRQSDEIMPPPSEIDELPSIDDVAGLEGIHAGTNELDAYREPAVVDMSSPGRVETVESGPLDEEGLGQAPRHSSEEVSPMTVAGRPPSSVDSAVGSIDADLDDEEPTLPRSNLGGTGLFASLVRSLAKPDSGGAKTIFDHVPEAKDFDPSLTRRIDPPVDGPRLPSVATPDLKLSKEAVPAPSLQWSTVVHESDSIGSVAHREEPKPISDVPSPRPSERTASLVPGQLLGRDFSDVVAAAAERRWFWASVSGVVAVVFGVGLVASNLISDPFGPPASSEVLTESQPEPSDVEPAAPTSQVEQVVDEPEPGSTAGGESTVGTDVAGVDNSSTTSNQTTTTQRRRTTRRTRPPTTSTARPTTTQGSGSTTAETTTSTSTSTSGTGGSTTTDSSTSSSGSTTEGSTSTTDPTSSSTESSTTSSDTTSSTT